MINLGERGYFVKRATSEPIQQICLRGERSSGTNFCQALIDSIPDVESWKTGWKHGFFIGDDLPPHCLLIGVVRHWRDWLYSMYRKPWHASERLHSLGFSDFIREPWDAYYQPKPSKLLKTQVLKQTSLTDRVLYADRQPIDGSKIANVLELRNLKLQNLLSLPHRNMNVLLIRYEWLNKDASALSRVLRDEFGMAQVPEFGRIETKFAGKYRWYPQYNRTVPEQLDPADEHFIKTALNRDVEAMLGYDLDA